MTAAAAVLSTVAAAIAAAIVAVGICSTPVAAIEPGVFSQTAGVASGGETTRVKIGTASKRENGCNASSQNFKFVIPHPEQLDLDYKGNVLAGIERVYTEHNGTVSDNNYAFTDNGTAIVFSLSAKGGGHYIHSPFGGGGVCVDATGANITVEIFAHQKKS
jgi:hypothetical protein